MRCWSVVFVSLAALVHRWTVVVVGGRFFVPHEIPAACDQREDEGLHAFYFDPVQLECRPCAQDRSLQTTASDGLGCICAKNSRLTKDFGGDISCEKCSDDETVSRDGWECIRCSPSTCRKRCLSTEISVERKLDGSWPNKTPERVCKTCSEYTRPNFEQTRCEHCGQSLSIVRHSRCICKAPYQKVGDICFRTPDNPNLKTVVINQVSFDEDTFDSQYFKDNFETALALCSNEYRNSDACQRLANMCVLILYQKGYYYGDTACTVYLQLFESKEGVVNSSEGPRLNHTLAMPRLYYSLRGPNILKDASISTRFVLGKSRLEFVAALYHVNGSFLGFQDVSGGLLQLCRNSRNMLDAAFEFGVHYVQKCEIPVKQLWNETKPTIFYELWLRVTEKEKSILHEVPVVLSDYISPTGSSNNKEQNPNAWQLFRRFFLVDGVSGVRADVTGSDQKPKVEVIRYAESLSFTIRLQSDYNDVRGGLIFPPCLRVNYSVATLNNHTSKDHVTVQFEVVYQNDQVQTKHNVFVAMAFLGTIALVWSCVQTSSWFRRAGKMVIDLSSLFKFLLILIGFVGEVFFVLIFCASLWWLVCFKMQKSVIIFGDNPLGHIGFSHIMIFPFVFQLINVLHLIVNLVTVDIFFVDWETTRDCNNAQGLGPTAPMWRTYFVMRHWNQLQAERKVNPAFQMFASLFLLDVVGLGNLATEDPSLGVKVSDAEYRAETTYVFRFACFGAVYFIVAVLQIAWFRILEIVCTNKIRHIVDLCFVANISVFVLETGLHGYYIHGRNSNCRSDIGLRDMYCNLLRETATCRKRGLLPQTKDQEFQMEITRLFKLQFDRILRPIFSLPNPISPAADELKRQCSDRNEVFVTPEIERSVCAYSIMNRFLRRFLDHEYCAYDYVVKNKNMAEEILNLEFQLPKKVGFFYTDGRRLFHRLFFYGHEKKILIFEILLFGVVNLSVKNYVLSGLVVYFVSTSLIATICKAIARVNVARKSLVDKRFLI